MTDMIDYALMAGAAYDSTRKNPNKIPYPGASGWGPLKDYEHRLSTAIGFEGVAFVKGKDIVISFAGTYPGVLDFGADVLLGSGMVEGQLIAAAVYYEDIKKAYPESDGYHYTFTGHSLGGGLAALMGVFFNKPAVTFNPAPFRNSATMNNALQLGRTLTSFGYATDPDLASYFAVSIAGIPFAIRGVNKVTATAVAGEFLSIGASDPLRIRAGSTDMVYNGSSDQGGLNGFGMNVLHAQTLLIALKQSIPFKTATFAMPYLIPDLFDENLFAKPGDKEGQQDLLSLLVRREFGVPGTSVTDTDLLTKFGQDMLSLATSGEVGRDIRQSLERIAFAYYYGQETGETKVFFDEVSGGLRFDMTNMATLGNAEADYIKFQDWLVNNAPGEAAAEIRSYLAEFHRMTLALDKTLNVESPLDDTADFMFSGTSGGNLDGGGGDDLLIGRAGADTLKGGTGNDKLYGGTGADTLTGGEGDDILIGGEGNDTYIWNEGDGADRITDSDGKGRIVIQGAGTDLVASGNFAESAEGSGIWTSPDGSFTLTNNGTWKLSTRSGGLIELNGFSDGDFGIYLKDAATETTYDYTITGDIRPADFNADNVGIQAEGDALGNPIGTAQPYEDILIGGAGNDHILSGELSDNIGARGGDDWIESGNGSDYVHGEEGDDLIEGGAGSDILAGDAGNDLIYGNLKTDSAAAIANGNTDSATGAKGDWLAGNEGDDILITGADNDVLSGGAGADLLIAGAGDDNILGDADYTAAFLREDTPRYSMGSYNWYHTSSDTFNWTVTSESYSTIFAPVVGETRPAGGGADVIYAGAGNDSVWAGEGDDTAYLEDGNDKAWGDEGDDVILGGAGDDLINGDNASEFIPASLHGSDFLDGGDGNDQLYGAGAADTLYGGAGDDLLSGDDGDENAGDDYLDGEGGNDTLFGAAGADTLYGGAGNDKLYGDSSDTAIDKQGDDYLDGEDGDDTLLGSGGADTLFGGDGADFLQGDGGTGIGDGDDYLDGEAGNDTLLGEGGNDVLFGDVGNDTLAGGAGDDILSGDDGNDTLFGQAGNDTLTGDAGNDYLLGGTGDDILDGGDGDDVYYISAFEGKDRIVDSGGTDWLVFKDIYWGDIVLGVGSLKLTVKSTGQEIHLDDFDPDNPLAAGGIEYFQFADGTVKTKSQLIQALGFTPTGTPGDDVLSGTALNDTITALAGNDSVTARGGNDTVYLDAGDDYADAGDGDDTVWAGDGDDIASGGNGADRLDGGAGNDVLAGGAGNDTLEDGEGNDTYLFGPGDGQDVAIDSAGIDAVQLTGGLTEAQISLQRLGSDLIVAVKGTADKLTVKDWFAPAGNFQSLMLGDGSMLDRTCVEERLTRNQAPVAMEDLVAASEDGIVRVAGNALANDADPEGRTLRVSNPGIYTGNYGALTLDSAGAYAYTLDNNSAAVQSLAAGQTVTERFGYSATDDDPNGAATSASAIVVTITGANDAPLIAADRGAVAEDGTLSVAGNVLANDRDVDAGTVLRVTSPGTIVSTYGSATLAADGSYNYTLDNASTLVQSLGRNQQITERFGYSVSDGIAGIAATLEITVAGANDAPVIASALADQTVSANTAYSWQMPANSFVDPDYGDALAYRATLADGSALPSWLVFDAATQTFSGRVPKTAAGSLDISVTATDGVAGQSSNLSVSDVFRLSFASGGGGGGSGGNGSSTGNEGVGNGVDAPPPGQDYSFNDGAGTSPGNPGAQGGDGYQPLPDVAHADIRIAAPEPIRAGAAAIARGHGINMNNGQHAGSPGTAAVARGHGSRTNNGPHAGTSGTPAPDAATTANATASNGHEQDGTGNGSRSAMASGKSADAWQEPTYLDPGKVNATSGNAHSASDNTGVENVLARWMAMDELLAAHLAKNDEAALGNGIGSGMGMIDASGFLGSATPFADPLSLSAGKGNNLQTLQGLKEGFRQAA